MRDYWQPFTPDRYEKETAGFIQQTLNAEDCLMPEQKPLSKQWEELHPAMKCVGIAIVFLGMVAVFSNLSGEKDAAGPKPSAAPALRIGQDYRLSAPGGDQELWLGVSKQDADEITSALVAKDMARIYGLLKSGQALVPARPLLI